LVMEYVPGGSLQDRLDRHGPLALPEILRIGMQTAAGLAAAHAQGLVHRDVKPANILLENGIERVKLTDFGLARAMADASMTQSGLIAGTPHYMAPEQARGESVDHRADLFSLGSTLYAMCTGVPPFRAETPMAVVRRVADDRPRPIRELNPEIPAWLEAIVERLHAKSPGERFASASELADLLGRCLAHVQQPLADVLPAGLIPKAEARPSGGRARWLVAAPFLAIPVALGLTFAYRVWWRPRADAAEDPPDPRVAAARAGAGTMPIIPSLWRTPDETDDLYRAAWDRAGQIEADLHRPGDPPVADPVAAMVRELADRAVRLERELAPGHGPAPALPTVSPHPQPRTAYPEPRTPKTPTGDDR